MHDGKSHSQAPAWRPVAPLTRRSLLGATAAACSAAMPGAGPAWAAPASGPSVRQHPAILAVSRALAVFPVAFLEHPRWEWMRLHDASDRFQAEHPDPPVP